MSAHTPGPWRAVRDEVYTSKTRRVCPRVTAGESLPIGKDYERAVANARLIAAAPDLLEALRAICDEQDAREGYAAPDTYDKARAAIAKATGEQQ